MAVYSTIQDYVKNKNAVPNLKAEQQLALLLDFDKD
jgi:hypothetical protein